MINVLLTAGLACVVLWMLGLITSYTFGGLVHILLAAGVVMFIVWAVLYLQARLR